MRYYKFCDCKEICNDPTHWLVYKKELDMVVNAFDATECPEYFKDKFDKYIKNLTCDLGYVKGNEKMTWMEFKRTFLMDYLKSDW